MVYIITGATHTGKTALAKRLVSMTGSFCLSVDHLKMGLIRSGNTSLTVYDDDALTGYLWPIVREMIKTAVENSQDLIVEGFYVPSYWEDGFDENYLREIRLVCLVMTEEYISRHFSEIAAHESDAEHRIHDSDLTPDALISDNRVFSEGFSSSGCEILTINSDWNSAVGRWLDCMNQKE